MICYYHNRDLDGFCSGAIMRRKLPNAEFIGYDYGQPFEQIVGEEIIMADVSLPMPTMQKVAQASGFRFIWIDHHASAIKDFKDFFGEGYDGINAILQDGIAACEIAWNYFFPKEKMPIAVSLLGKYDTWRNQDPYEWENRILPFQYGMRMICNSLESFPDYLLETGSKVAVGRIIETGKSILQYQAQQDEMACRLAAFETTFKGLRAICLNTGARNSQTFKSVWDESRHDIMLPFSLNGKTGKWSFSIYTTKDEIDCSALAKEMGGGGHRKAAGFEVANIQSVFE